MADTLCGEQAPGAGEAHTLAPKGKAGSIPASRYEDHVDDDAHHEATYCGALARAAVTAFRRRSESV